MEASRNALRDGAIALPACLLVCLLPPGRFLCEVGGERGGGCVGCNRVEAKHTTRPSHCIAPHFSCACLLGHTDTCSCIFAYAHVCSSMHVRVLARPCSLWECRGTSQLRVYLLKIKNKILYQAQIELSRINPYDLPVAVKLRWWHVGNVSHVLLFNLIAQSTDSLQSPRSKRPGSDKR